MVSSESASLSNVLAALRAPTRVIDAAMRAGALGAYLSGAGSSVLALIEGTKLHDTVGGAMQKALADHGHGGFSRSVDIDFGGCIVEEIT